MKNRYINSTIIVLLCVFALSCKKNVTRTIDTPVDVTSVALIKYFNFSPGSPSINFYANDVKVSAIVSATGAEATAGIAYGGVYPSSSYSIIKQGNTIFKGKIPSTATKDADVVTTTLETPIDVGGTYSLYACGIYNATAKTTDAFMIKDVLPAVDYSQSYVRFVNTIPNGTASMILAVKNTATSQETIIGNATSYKQATDFVALPAGVYELYARYATTPTVNLISRTAAAGGGTVSLIAGRVYTVATKGDITITSTTAANRPSLDFISNR